MMLTAAVVLIVSLTGMIFSLLALLGWIWDEETEDLEERLYDLSTVRIVSLVSFGTYAVTLVIYQLI